MKIHPENVHEQLDNDARDVIISYALGMLDEEAASRFEHHMGVHCHACRDELDAFRVATGWLTLAPPAETRARSRVPHSRRIVRAAHGMWHEPSPGLFIKELDHDAHAQRTTILCRMDPGTAAPTHDHHGPEQCFVLQGELRVAGTAFRAGDYVREPEGSTHTDVYTESGCTLFLTVADQDLARS